MKKHLLQFIMFYVLISLIAFQQTSAQEKKSSTISITITEDEKVTIDTTFELAEGQDPEMIKEMVAHMAGGDVHAKHMSQEVHVSHNGDEKMVWVTSGGHPDVDGDVSVKEVDEDHEMFFSEDDHGEPHEMVFVTVEEGGDIETEHTVIIHTDADCEGKEKRIEVTVYSEEDVDVDVEKEKVENKSKEKKKKK